MSKFTNPLENIKIASPCAANWEEMYGNERRRFCGDCKLNVYNLLGMTRDEAENLILQSEGRLCVRFYKRADGSILTKDCPVGWQAIKRNISKTAAAFASLVFAVLSGVSLANYFTESETHTMGTVARKIENPKMDEIAVSDTNIEIQGKPIMGGISLANNNNIHTAGELTNLDKVRSEIKTRRKR